MSVPLPESSGCAWPIDPACFTTEWDALDESVQDRAVALASATLTRLTGYRVGTCPITVRPCRSRCAGSEHPAYWDMQSSFGGSFWPHIEGGVWVNSCGCRTDCSCADECVVALPPPVGEVLSVQVGTETLDPDTDYRIDGALIVFTGSGECPFPSCQDMSAPVGQEGAFAITYRNSWPVDSLGAYAAGVLANEYAKACTGGKCRLPAGVTSITRQGVSIDIASGAFPGGVTGIREVDSYLALWNPAGNRQASTVWSPDLSSPRVVR